MACVALCAARSKPVSVFAKGQARPVGAVAEGAAGRTSQQALEAVLEAAPGAALEARSPHPPRR